MFTKQERLEPFKTLKCIIQFDEIPFVIARIRRKHTAAGGVGQAAFLRLCAGAIEKCLIERLVESAIVEHADMKERIARRKVVHMRA